MLILVSIAPCYRLVSDCLPPFASEIPGEEPDVLVPVGLRKRLVKAIELGHFVFGREHRLCAINTYRSNLLHDLHPEGMDFPVA